MKEQVLEIIRLMQQKKELQNIVPAHITMVELNGAIKRSLRELLDEEKIEAGPTANDTYLRLPAPEKKA